MNLYNPFRPDQGTDDDTVVAKDPTIQRLINALSSTDDIPRVPPDVQQQHIRAMRAELRKPSTPGTKDTDSAQGDVTMTTRYMAPNDYPHATIATTSRRHPLLAALAILGTLLTAVAAGSTIIHNTTGSSAVPIIVTIPGLAHQSASPRIITRTVIKHVPVVQTVIVDKPVYVTRPLPTAIPPAKAVTHMAPRLLHISDFFNSGNLIAIDTPGAAPSPPVKIAGVPFATGIEMDAGGGAELSMNTQTLPGYTAIAFYLGMGDESGTDTTSSLKVYRDGAFFKSFQLQAGLAVQRVSIPFGGSTIIKLVASNGNNGCCPSEHVVLGNLEAVAG